MHKPIKVFCFILLFLSACSFFNKQEKKEDAIARVYDKYLYLSDLKGLIPAGVSPRDSIFIARNYINNWIKEQVILKKAENNLTDEQKSFTQKIEEYRNSLVVYTYENKLIGQKLDTNVSKEDIEKYYNENKEDFELKENIMRVIYVKLPINSPVVMNVRNLYRSQDHSKLKELSVICENYAVNHYLNDSTWLFFNDLLKEIPIKTYNQEQYLQNHRIVEMSDTSYHYFLNIRDFKIKESISPISLEEDRIKNIIINKRKIELIKKMHKDILETASQNNDFEIFNN